MSATAPPRPPIFRHFPPLGEWEKRALCKGINPEQFFMASFNRYLAVVCSNCPVRQECLEDAMEMEKGQRTTYRFGLRGGLTAPERAQLQRRRDKGLNANV